jgi:enolase
MTHTVLGDSDGGYEIGQPDKLPLITNLCAREVLNSHGQWTTEFVVGLEGSEGAGCSPQGETLSQDERSGPPARSAEEIVRTVDSLHGFKAVTDQVGFDALLDEQQIALDNSTKLALSLAYLDAACKMLRAHPYALMRRWYGLPEPATREFPALLFNVFNGSYHAYTNPVLSDFHEYLLVPKVADVRRQLECFRDIGALVKKRLLSLPRVHAGDNPVHRGERMDNTVWIELVLGVLAELGLENDFSLMIDAAAGHLRTRDGYQLTLTQGGLLSTEQMLGYWREILSQYPVQLLEDPFGEQDVQAWAALTAEFPDRLIAGDDLCSGQASAIEAAADRGMISAVMIKPNQAGTVTAVVRAMKIAMKRGLVAIPSHRSIETEPNWLSDLCYAFGVHYVKLGLMSDFETITKLNRLVRYFDEIGYKGPFGI